MRVQSVQKVLRFDAPMARGLWWAAAPPVCIKPLQPGCRPGKNMPTAPVARGNAPLLPPPGEVPPIGGDRGAFPSDDSPVVKVFAADRQRCRRQAAITCGDRRHHNPLNLLNLLNLLNPLNPSRRAAPIGVHFHRAKPGCLVFHSAKQNYKTHRREAAPTAIPHPLNPLNLLNPHADRRVKRPVNLLNLQR